MAHKQKKDHKQKNGKRKNKGHPKEESKRQSVIEQGLGPVATLDRPDSVEVPAVTVANAVPAVKHEVTPPMRMAQARPTLLVRSEELPLPMVTAVAPPETTVPAEWVQASSSTVPPPPDDQPPRTDPAPAPSETGTSSGATGQASPGAQPPIDPSMQELSRQPMYSTTPSDVAAAMASSAAGTAEETGAVPESDAVSGATAEEGGEAGKRDPILPFIALGLILVGVVAIIVIAAIV